jgi:hypothetical protein
MKKNKVIKYKNLPSKIPIFPTLTTWLALDHWHAPQWLYGAIGLIFLNLWVLCIIGIFHQDQTDIFNTEKTK